MGEADAAAGCHPCAIADMGQAGAGCPGTGPLVVGAAMGDGGGQACEFGRIDRAALARDDAGNPAYGCQAAIQRRRQAWNIRTLQSSVVRLRVPARCSAQAWRMGAGSSRLPSDKASTDNRSSAQSRSGPLIQ